jgi:hypothetical protein
MDPAMAKAMVGKAAPRTAKRKARGAKEGRGEAATVLARSAKTGRRQIDKVRFEAVMQAAERSGLLGEKSGRIGGRVSAALVKQAKERTGIEADTDLIEFALASVALEDKFAEVFRESRGKVDADLKLGF